MRGKLGMFVYGSIASTVLAACNQTTQTVDVDLPMDVDFSDGFQQSDADAILSECKADKIKLKVGEDGYITFEPSPSADYDASVCVLDYIKKSGTTKFGFVGNERYVIQEKGQ